MIADLSERDQALLEVTAAEMAYEAAKDKARLDLARLEVELDRERRKRERS